MKYLYAAKILCLMIIAPQAAFSSPIDLSSFSVVQYSGIQPENARWVLGSSDTRVTQTNNNNLSFYLSDFDVANSLIQWEASAINGDDDVIGFVWGYQDRRNYNRFFWAGQNNSARAHKVVDGILEGIGAASVQWQLNVMYDFLFDFTSGESRLEISNQGAPVLAIDIFDTTWATGRFGFLTESQSGRFQSLEIQANPEPVPTPSVIALMMLGLSGCFLVMRGRGQRSPSP